MSLFVVTHFSDNRAASRVVPGQFGEVASEMGGYLTLGFLDKSQ
jgi:hypothetical protein